MCGSEIILFPVPWKPYKFCVCSSLICACATPHTCRLLMASSEQLPDLCPESKSILDRGGLPLLSWWILLLDFSNAFNRVIREHMFCEIHAKVARSVKLGGMLL